MHEAEARVAAAWQRHLAWPNVRIELGPPCYWFVAANRLFAAHERTPGQQRCAEEGKWILMYVGRVYDPASARPGKHPAKVCLFQVDAVEGNVINFVDASPYLQNFASSFLGAEEGAPPQPGSEASSNPEAALALHAPGRPLLPLAGGLRPALAAARPDRPEGTALTVHAPGSLREAVATEGALWMREGAQWRAFVAPAGLDAWLASPAVPSPVFGRPLPAKTG